MSDNPGLNASQSTGSGENSPQSGETEAAGSITPEMVSAIADKVYDMLLRELKYGRERHQFTPRRPLSPKGGR